MKVDYPGTFPLPGTSNTKELSSLIRSNCRQTETFSRNCKSKSLRLGRAARSKDKSGESRARCRGVSVVFSQCLKIRQGTDNNPEYSDIWRDLNGGLGQRTGILTNVIPSVPTARCKIVSI